MTTAWELNCCNCADNLNKLNSRIGAMTPYSPVGLTSAATVFSVAPAGKKKASAKERTKKQKQNKDEAGSKWDFNLR